MATDANVVLEPGLAAASDLSAAANQYRGVKLDVNGDVILCDTQGEEVYGVLYNLPKAGEPAQVAVGGSPKIKIGAAVNEMDNIMVDADGDFIAATGVTNRVFAIAKTAGAADGVIITATISRAGFAAQA